jgi:hypothetical protein
MQQAGVARRISRRSRFFQKMFAVTGKSVPPKTGPIRAIQHVQ